MPRTRITAIALAAALALTGCTPPGPDKPHQSPSSPAAVETPPPSPAPEPLEMVWQTDLNILSGPRKAGSTALAYVYRKDRLFLVGLDPTTGEELWRQEASPSAVVSGIAVTPAVVAGYPVYFRPSAKGNLFAQLVVAEPTTGKDLVQTEPMLFTTTPSSCDDARSHVCIRASTGHGYESRAYRLDTDGDGELFQPFVPGGQPGEGFRPVGSNGLVSIVVDDTEYLAVQDGVKELWRRPVSDFFPSGYSTDFGWAFTFDEDTDRFYGHIGRDFEETDGHQIRNFSDETLVAIERSTGKLLWAESGVRHQCNYTLEIPAPPAWEQDALSRAVGDDLAIRCRYEGTIITTPNSTPEFRDVDVILEGYDPETGTAIWEVPLGDAMPLLGTWLGNFTSDRLMRAQQARIVLTLDGKSTTIDLETGERTDYSAAGALWCTLNPAEFEYREPLYFDGEPVHTRRGESLGTWCDLNGKQLTDPARLPAELPSGIGTKFGDLRIVATPEGLTAYR